MIRHYGAPPNGPISGSLYDLSGRLTNAENALSTTVGSQGGGILGIPFFLASWLVQGLGS